MGFLKKLAGVFGFGQEAVKNEEDDTVIDSGDGDKRRENNQPRFRETRLPRKGFGVPVQVAVERSQLGPVLQPCSAGDGGIQVFLFSFIRFSSLLVDCFIYLCVV